VHAAHRDVKPTGVIDDCRQQLAGYKCPKNVDVIDTIPRNASGKVLKLELRAPYREGRDRGVNETRAAGLNVVVAESRPGWLLLS